MMECLQGRFKRYNGVLMNTAFWLTIFANYLCYVSFTESYWIVELKTRETVLKYASLWQTCFNFGALNTKSADKLELNSSEANLELIKLNSDLAWLRKPLHWKDDCCSPVFESECTFWWNYVQRIGYKCIVIFQICAVFFLIISNVVMFLLKFNFIPMHYLHSSL